MQDATPLHPLYFLLQQAGSDCPTQSQFFLQRGSQGKKNGHQDAITFSSFPSLFFFYLA